MSILDIFKKAHQPDPTTLLKKEHDRFRALLEQAKKTTERSLLRREKIFSEMLSLLALHETVEEKTLYALLKKHSETQSIVLEGIQEHHLTDLLLAELKKMAVSDEKWGPKFHVMGEGLEHHLKEEENKMFPLVKKILSEKELITVVEKMRLMRENPKKSVRILKGNRPSKIVQPQNAKRVNVAKKIARDAK